MDSGKEEMTWLVTIDSENNNQRKIIIKDGAANHAKE